MDTTETVPAERATRAVRTAMIAAIEAAETVWPHLVRTEDFAEFRAAVLSRGNSQIRRLDQEARPWCGGGGGGGPEARR